MSAPSSLSASAQIISDAAHEAAGRELRPYSGVFAVFLCGSFAFLDLYCLQPLLPLIAGVFHASEASASSTISSSTLGVAMAAILLAFFGERLHRKRTIVSAIAALAATACLTETAQSLWALTCWRFLQGLLTPCIFIITITYITEEWRPLLVPRVMSIYVAGTVFGGFVGRVAGGLIAERYGWQVMFLALGIAGFGGALGVGRFLEPGARRPLSRTGGNYWKPFADNLRNRRLLATFGIGFCMLFTLVSVFSYITFYLAAAPFFLSTSTLSWLFAVYLFGLMATLLVGTILARIGLRHGMVAAIGVCLLGVVLTTSHSLVAVAIGLAFASSGVFIAQTCANSFLRDAAPAGARVSAAGMYICIYYLGGTAGGVLPGLAWRWTGWPGCVLMIAGFLTVAGITAFFGWRQRSGVPDPIPL